MNSKMLGFLTDLVIDVCYDIHLSIVLLWTTFLMPVLVWKILVLTYWVIMAYYSFLIHIFGLLIQSLIHFILISNLFKYFLDIPPY